MILKEGLKNADVKQWQVFLNFRGEKLIADGNFGGMTKAATQRFQKQFGLTEDGIVGPGTLAKAAELGFSVLQSNKESQQISAPDAKVGSNSGLQSNKNLARDMTISQRGLDFIKGFEREILKVYDDGYGFPTAGIGHLLTPDEKKKFPMGTPITKEQSLAWFAKDVADHADPVKELVTVALTQGQYDALVSLVFNIGGTNFRKSTLLRQLNLGNYSAAKAHFDDWIKSNGQVSRGLVRRRNEEQVIFDS